VTLFDDSDHMTGVNSGYRIMNNSGMDRGKSEMSTEGPSKESFYDFYPLRVPPQPPCQFFGSNLKMKRGIGYVFNRPLKG
jgi:hypothetical protein